MSLRVGFKVLPGVYAGARVGGRRRKSRSSRSPLLAIFAVLVAVGFLLQHAWLIFGVIIPIITAVFCFFMAYKMHKRKHP